MATSSPPSRQTLKCLSETAKKRVLEAPQARRSCSCLYKLSRVPVPTTATTVVLESTKNGANSSLAHERNGSLFSEAEAMIISMPSLNSGGSFVVVEEDPRLKLRPASKAKSAREPGVSSPHKATPVARSSRARCSATPGT